jgi:hypothetical protein
VPCAAGLEISLLIHRDGKTRVEGGEGFEMREPGGGCFHYWGEGGRQGGSSRVQGKNLKCTLLGSASSVCNGMYKIYR